MVRVMPPWGAASKHTLHHRGFLRDGLLSIRRISQPPTPANGLPQASHRGADGSFERSRTPRRTLAWPNSSKNRAQSSALACAPWGRGGVRLFDIPHSRTACPSATAAERVVAKGEVLSAAGDPAPIHRSPNNVVGHHGRAG